MTAEFVKPSKILAVADAGGDQVALESALALADAQGAALEVIACVEPPHDLTILSRLSGEDPDRLIDEAVEHTRQIVSRQLAESLNGRSIEVEVAVGKTYLQIIQHVAKSGSDFVIKKAEPLSGVHRFLFASTDQHLLRKCPCPVWLQTEAAPTRPRRILAAVDLDVWDAAEPQTLKALNRRVVDAASMIADGPDAEVIVLHAWDALGEGMIWAFSGGSHSRMSSDKYVNEILEARHEAMTGFLAEVRGDDDRGPRLIPRLARGAPERVIHEQCREVAAEVVVMGTVARTGLSGVFIGNTAENIINSLECPVLAVKPDGFVSPLLRG